jgi:hypothetical protein
MNTAVFFNFPAAGQWNPVFSHEQKKWLKKQVQPLEPLSAMLARAYVEKAKRTDYQQANSELREATHKMQRHDLNLSWPDDELAAWCERKAERGADLLRKAECTDDGEKIMGLVLDGLALLSRYGMKLPDVDALGMMGFLKRLADPAWWRKQARTFQRQEVEKLAILLRRVCKGREIYCSDETVRRRSAQRHRNRKYLEATEAENEEGQRYTLAELADLSNSNPRIKRGELMLRIRGFDEVAQLLGHVREFWTMTTPSRFHRWTTVGNIPRENKKWQGATPRDAQDWLTACWSRIRAALARHGVRLYGFRVVEAHHDGTPHWHAALFYLPLWNVRAKYSHWPRIPTKPEKDNGNGKTGWEFSPCELGRKASPRVRAIVRNYLLQEEREPLRKSAAAGCWDDVRKLRAPLRDAVAHRCDFKDIDPAKGDAAGYLAKYITKAIDAADAGDLVQMDLYGYDMQDSTRRVEAWAAAWNVRQFQPIGGPSVSTWRELRRATSGDITQADLFDAPLHIQNTAAAADDGDWLAFVLLMGGPCVKRDAQPIRLGYWNEHDAETGEVLGSVFNKYGEPAEAALFGLTYSAGEGVIFTRVHSWTIHRPGEEKAETKTRSDLVSESSAVMREVDALQEWKPWAFDILAEMNLGQGFCFSGAPPGAPLEFCQ